MTRFPQAAALAAVLIPLVHCAPPTPDTNTPPGTEDAAHAEAAKDAGGAQRADGGSASSGPRPDAGTSNADGGTNNADAGGTVVQADAGTSSSGPPPVDTTCGTLSSPKVLHRLNRTEFDNTLRDLLGVQGSPAREFPNDDSTDGYDNQAASLTTSALLTEKLERSIDRVIEEALAPVRTHELDLTRQAESGEVEKPSGYDEGDAWALPFEGNNLYTEISVPRDGAYQIAINAYSHTTQVCEDGTRGDQPGKFCDLCIVYRSHNCENYGRCTHVCESNSGQGCFRDRTRYDVLNEKRGPARMLSLIHI